MAGTRTLQIPTMTTAQRNALVDPKNGMMIYNTDTLTNEYTVDGGSTWNYITFNVPPSRIKFVSNSGSNVSTGGSFDDPWQTISYALSQITDNATGNEYSIICIPGTYSDTTIALKSNINIIGNNSDWTITNQLTLDSDWSGIEKGICNIDGFNTWTLNGGTNIDFSTLGVTPTNSFMSWSNLTLDGDLTVTIKGTTSPKVTNLSLINVSGDRSFVLVDVLDLLEDNIVIGGGTITKNSGGDAKAIIQNSTINGSLTIVHNGSDTQSTKMINNVTLGLTITRNAGTNTCDFYNNSATAYSISGSGAIGNFYSANIAPNPNAGGVANYINSAYGINSSVTPLYYTPTTDRVQGNLQGIDNALLGNITTFVDNTPTPTTMVQSREYIANNVALTEFTLPATCTTGTEMRVIGRGPGGWIIKQLGSQRIQVGALSTTTGTGGSVASTDRWDGITLKCANIGNLWVAVCFVGTLTVV